MAEVIWIRDYHPVDSFLAYVFFNQWVVVLIVGLLMLVFSELGFRSGLRIFRTHDEERKGQVSGIQGAVLALLGLLLGFTFAMAANRYEVRRDLVLAEANDIGTTYLRASLLPAPHQAAVEELLRRYVDVRLNFYASGTDADEFMAAEKEAAQIQQKLWAETVAASKEAPTPLTVSFISSLNDTIDMDATRLNAFRSHVPGPVWMLVLVVACAGCYATGYVTGSGGARSPFTNLLLPLLIMVVITLISDLDRPRSGLVGISQQPLIDLKASLPSN